MVEKNRENILKNFNRNRESKPAPVGKFRHVLIVVLVLTFIIDFITFERFFFSQKFYYLEIRFCILLCRSSLEI